VNSDAPFAPNDADDELSQQFRLWVQRSIAPLEQASERLVSTVRAIGIERATIDFMRHLDRKARGEPAEMGCLAPLVESAAELAIGNAIRSELERLVDERGMLAVAIDFLRIQDPKKWRYIQKLIAEAGGGPPCAAG
jgi:hypothetical protein